MKEFVGDTQRQQEAHLRNSSKNKRNKKKLFQMIVTSNMKML